MGKEGGEEEQIDKLLEFVTIVLKRGMSRPSLVQCPWPIMTLPAIPYTSLP